MYKKKHIQTNRRGSFVHSAKGVTRCEGRRGEKKIPPHPPFQACWQGACKPRAQTTTPTTPRRSLGGVCTEPAAPVARTRAKRVAATTRGALEIEQNKQWQRIRQSRPRPSPSSPSDAPSIRHHGVAPAEASRARFLQAPAKPARPAHFFPRTRAVLGAGMKPPSLRDWSISRSLTTTTKAAATSTHLPVY